MPLDPVREDSPFSEYRRMILGELERLNRGQDAANTKLDLFRMEFQTRIQTLIDHDIAPIRIEVAMLKVKAGAWGAIAGLIPTALAVAYFLLNRGKG